MKNLKRVLSLALASVMVMGMMAVGASAADFNDKADIDHVEAVETLVALGIISGKENNNFDPKGTLTRAEMATIIAVIRNKGVAPKFGTKPTPTYTDIDNHWAESYIEYCNSFGIVGGIGGGKFDPEGKLTSTQAARMILNAMGYGIEDPSNWALLTEVQARDEGVDLYAGIDEEIADPTNAQITRDQMAQMAFNALNGNMANAEVTSTTYFVLEVTSDDTELKNDLSTMRFESAADADAVAKSNGLSAAAETDGYKIVKRTANTTETLGGKYLSLDDDATGVMASVKYNAETKKYDTVISGVGTFKAEEDFSALMGQDVKVLTNAKSGKVYGITANKGGVLFEGTVGDLTADATGVKTSIRVNGKEYKLTTKTEDVNLTGFNGGNGGSLKNITANAQFAMKGIDTNGDGKLNSIVYTPVVVTSISNITSKAVNVRADITVGESTTRSLSIEKGKEQANLYAGAAKNDWVVITEPATAVSGKAEIVKAEVMADVAANAYRDGNEVRVDGQWLTVLDDTDFATLSAMTKDATYDLVMVNGYVVDVALAEAGSTASKDMLILTKVASAPTAGLDSYIEARAYFLKDGSTGVIKLKAVDQKDIATAYPTNTLYAYTEKNGITTLVTPTANDAGTQKADTEATVSAAAGKTPAKINGMLIADDAKIYVMYGEAGKEKIEVVDAKTVRAWSTAYGTDAKGAAFYSAVNGINYVKMAFITDTEAMPGTTGVTGNLGYVVSDGYVTTVSGTKYAHYEIWDGEDVIEVNDVCTELLAKGALVEYTDKGDGIIDTTIYEENGDAAVDQTSRDMLESMTSGAVIGYNDADEVISFAGVAGDKVIDDKTTILYLDTKAQAGQATGTIELADEDEENPGTYTQNVKYVLDESHVELLIVDVNNDIGEEDLADDRANVTLTLTATTNFTATKVIYNGTEIASSEFSNGLKVKKGSTVTVVVKGTEAGKVQKLGVDVVDTATTPNVLGSLADKSASGTANQGDAEQSINVTISADITLTLKDHTAG